MQLTRDGADAISSPNARKHAYVDYICKSCGAAAPYLGEVADSEWNMVLVPTNETHSQLQEGDVVSFYDEAGNDTSPYSGTAKIIEIEYIQKLKKDYTVFYFKAN